MASPATRSHALLASAALMAAIVVAATAVACDLDDITVPMAPTFVATLNGASEVPAKAVPGTGTAVVVKNGQTYTYAVNFTGMTGPLIGAHIHGPGSTTVAVGIIVPFITAGATGTSGTFTGTFTSTNTPTISNDSLDVLMRNGNAYVNLHTSLNPGGEIRGQLSQQQ